MTDIRLYLNPQPAQVVPETGIGRVVLAQMKYLPALGFKLVSDPGKADIVACHVNRASNLPRIDVLHLHGLYYQDIPHIPYRSMHHEVNALIAQSAREALAITVPSEWVGMTFKRDMRLTPFVIPHGVDLDEWQGEENLGYVLWNKTRASDVCDPTPAYELARRGADVLSTFAPPGKEDPNLRVTGTMDAGKMKTVVSHAGVYLATAMETFGIGTLEALACGVPVLGYAWGGTLDIVRHGREGYLVEPGDIDGLESGLDWIARHRIDLSRAARARAMNYGWQSAVERYAALYRQVVNEKREEKHGTAVVIPCFNYGRYLEECVRSVQAQTRPAEEIIIVNDGSSDNSLEIAARLAEGDSRIRVIDQKNQGVAAARNAGIRAAKSPYIICLDADDRIGEEYIAVCQRAMESDRSLGVAYTGLLLHGEGGEPIPSRWPPEFDWSIMTTVSVPPSNCIPSAAMFRRSMWERAGGYRQVYAPAEDTEFWVRGLASGFNARKVSNAGLFIYRAHDGSASRTKTYHAIDQWHPWMRDKKYPFAAPGVKRPAARSYASPAVSVIIPVGPGHERYLPAALDSLLGQTERAWEAVVIDDTGIGISEETLKPYPFARLVSTGTTPKGAGAARNIGLMQARAPLCLFLDADDYLDPTALEKMLRLYLVSEGRYVYTDWNAVCGKEVRTYQADEYSPELWLSRVVNNVPGINAVTVMMSTEDAREVMFDEDMPGWEDRDFFANCAARGIHGVRLSEALLYYRVDTGSRRAEAMKQTKNLGALLARRYGPYVKGVKKMAPCCGSTGENAIIAAKRALGVSIPDGDAPVIGNQTVRMEFTGAEVGPVWYQGVEGSGRKYRGANTAQYRFIDAHPQDAAKLELSGKWKRVERGAVMPISDEQRTGPKESPAELRAKAEAALLRAKAEAEALVEVEAPAAPVEAAAPAVRRKERPAGRK